MAVFPCPTKSLCVDPSTPFANLSAEAPDGEIYIGYNWGYGPSYPPLGSDFTQTGCEGTCQSEVSQEDADICAANQNAACTSVIFPVSTVVPDRNGFPAVLNRPRPLFGNTPQTATVSCPDGNPFVYTVPAGKFQSFNQPQADAIALSFAQEQAPLFLLCLGDLSNPRVCSGSSYTDSITASGNFLAAPPAGNVWELVSGALPPGISITEFIFNTGLVVGNTIHFTGTCMVPGVYQFMLQVTDSQGDTMTKPYQITVAGINDQFSFGNGTVGTAYSVDVTSAGVTNPIYSVESGSLPTGLSLDPGGIIFGTPTTPGTFNFTLGVTEAGTGMTCVAPPSSIMVSAACAQNIQDIVWAQSVQTACSNGANIVNGLAASWSLVNDTGACGENQVLTWAGVICNPVGPYLVTVTLPWGDSGTVNPPFIAALSLILIINGVQSLIGSGDVFSVTPNPLVVNLMLPGNQQSSIEVFLELSCMVPAPTLEAHSIGNLSVTPLTHP